MKVVYNLTEIKKCLNNELKSLNSNNICAVFDFDIRDSFSNINGVSVYYTNEKNFPTIKVFDFEKYFTNYKHPWNWKMKDLQNYLYEFDYDEYIEYINEIKKFIFLKSLG